jgi:hypothetical protein
VKKLYFCWEMTMSGVWGPVCYHDQVPDVCPTRRSAVHEVPAELVDLDGSARFGELARRFPAPKSENLTEEISPC